MIRAITPADVGTVLQLIRDLAAYERDPDAVKATHETLHEALFGATPAAEAVLAEIDGEAVGVALFFFNFSTWSGKRGLYLEDLFVREAARGTGTGTALLRHLARIAIERDCARFEWAVLDWNAPAIGFYKSIGAVAMTDWTIMRVEGDALAKLAA
ncbi:GNAT family N-acetyltransferase [Glacieibacterium frigidum]|uniref:GNAT family N-acetyltransferase n=1 Tax=Glacieibacterium frigidum TaxID=2593303 RepID=A0A552UGF2_9SPHN|nr:GNAT family N-acetyltransferase [Glacieibacterium frigidum]TRW17294.1 GNAT family N-acetyltransferase [Glacieibacterium frigidum]